MVENNQSPIYDDGLPLEAEPIGPQVKGLAESLRKSGSIPEADSTVIQAEPTNDPEPELASKRIPALPENPTLEQLTRTQDAIQKRLTSLKSKYPNLFPTDINVESEETEINPADAREIERLTASMHLIDVRIRNLPPA